MAAGAQNPPETVVLFDFTKGSALVAAAASLINCRKNQRNAQVLDFVGDFWVSGRLIATEDLAQERQKTWKSARNLPPVRHARQH
jgi:hypothetical protein